MGIFDRAYGFVCLLVVFTVCAVPVAAQESTRRVIIEDVPTLKPIKRVSAEHTHSGFPVPRYVSLKYGKVNGRQGPSLKHPVLWQYQRRGLPLIVVAEMDIWRKVRDINGDESWVRTQALSGEKNVIMRETAVLRHKPKASARAVAVTDKGALLSLEECNPENWCEVKSHDGHKGWVKREILWGAAPL